MNKTSFENYPIWTVLIANLQSLLINAFGIFILSKFGWIVATIYALFILLLEYRLLITGCVNCYYYGKLCFSGHGLLCSFLLKKGDPTKFSSRNITWKDLFYDLLISLIPFVAGICLLIIHFSWAMLLAVIALLLLSSLGNGFIRGNLACVFCKQRELGCPAEKLFKKTNKT